MRIKIVLLRVKKPKAGEYYYTSGKPKADEYYYKYVK